MELATAAGDFLVAAAERLRLDSHPAQIRAMLDRACGGQLSGRAADGSRASGLTVTGIPFEASVTGGRGQLTPSLRYVTEAGSRYADFGSRLTAQLTAIEEVATPMPNGGDAVADTLRSFVAALYPDPASVPAQRHFATWLGVVHHGAAPDHAAGLKLYGSLKADPNALDRLCAVRPEFAGLLPDSVNEDFVELYGAAIDIDANGIVSPKIYLRAKYGDIATPMKLVRQFGDPAWTILSELVRCGADAAALHRFQLFVCCGRRDGTPTFALYVDPRRRGDITALVRELAAHHHGTTAAVDALVQAAEVTGATWRYSVVSLGYSPTHGIDKLNVYCVPAWDVD